MLSLDVVVVMLLVDIVVMAVESAADPIDPIAEPEDPPADTMETISRSRIATIYSQHLKVCIMYTNN